jgi:hypothetical protein
MDKQNRDNRRLESELKRMHVEIQALKEELLPERLAKAMDSSFNRIRLFLQILSIMITLFLGGAVSLGFFGVKNIVDIYREAAEIRTIAANVAKDQNDVAVALKTVKDMETDMRSQSRELQRLVNQAITDARASFDEAVTDVQDKSRSHLSEFEKSVNRELSCAQVRIDRIQNHLRDISSIFNAIAVRERSKLTPRETQLLTLIAQQIDPNNALLNFNYAQSAFYFGRYDEAIAKLDIALRQTSLSPDISKVALDLRQECEKRKISPPTINRDDPNGPRGLAIGGYGIMQLHVKTIEALWKNGYLTVEQAQHIFEEAKVKQ